MTAKMHASMTAKALANLARHGAKYVNLKQVEADQRALDVAREVLERTEMDLRKLSDVIRAGIEGVGGMKKA